MNDETRILDPQENKKKSSLNTEAQQNAKSHKSRLKSILLAAGGLVAGTGISWAAMESFFSDAPAGHDAGLAHGPAENLKPAEEPVIHEVAPLATSVDDSQTFPQAFAEARSELGSGGVFEWHGTLYNTYYKEEWSALSPDQQTEFAQSYQDIGVDEGQDVTHDPVTEDVQPIHTDPGQTVSSENEAQTAGSGDNVSHATDDPGITVDPVQNESVHDAQGDPGGNANVIGVEVDDQGNSYIAVDTDGNGVPDAYLADMNADGEVDVVVVDANEDLDPDDVIDVSSEHISVADVIGEPGTQPEVPGDVAYTDDSGLPDYMNDAPVNDMTV